MLVFCIGHSREIPYGTEKNLMQEKGAVGGWVGKKKHLEDEHRSQRIIAQLVIKAKKNARHDEFC